MVTFSFREFGENLGTRQLGQQVREKLMPLLAGDERVVLDFTGVDVVSNSFADECIAKLLLTMPLTELKAHTTFRGFNHLATQSVLTALRRRIWRWRKNDIHNYTKRVYLRSSSSRLAPLARKVYSFGGKMCSLLYPITTTFRAGWLPILTM